ncbi:HugZ family protein [Mesorhizobium sp. 1B3]|uniref:HugZ family pyridoxamine 5'-phosphate oxidase n=1 Tax=Mesorhizobium sp. 1B3 TaxID=3243599 RepID=UPI003D98E417
MEEKKHVIRETDAQAIRLARTLIRAARYGAIAVLDPGDGAPMASRVAVATDLDGAPIILVSALSAHTGALVADPRCSLLVGEPGKGDPLAHPRISVSCRAVRLERGTQDHARAERRYLNRHPKGKLYAGFPDFSFFRLEPQGASLNGGFGKAYLLGRADLLVESAATDELAAREQGAIDHMNEDHADAIAVYARQFAKASGDGWVITGLDADGIDIANGDDIRRIFFPQPLAGAGELRQALVDLAKAGRALEGSPD